MLLRLVVAVCASLGALGCYAYAPLGTVEPSTGTELSLVLSDQGRVAAASTLGQSVGRVEGKVVQATDTAYVLHVSRVQDMRGAVSPWSGETVVVPRAWVGNATERRFSRPRTYLIASAFTAVLAAFIATRRLTGNGGPTTENPGGGGGSQQ